MSETRTPYRITPEEIMQRDEDSQQEAHVTALKREINGLYQVIAAKKFLLKSVYGVAWKEESQ